MHPTEKIKSVLEGKFFEYKKKKYQFMDCKSVNSRIMILTDTITLEAEHGNPDSFLEQVTIQQSDNHRIEVPSETKPVEVKPTETTLSEINRAIKAEIVTSNQRATRMADKMEEMFNKLCEASPSDELVKQATAMRDMSNSIVNLETLKFKMLNNL